MNLTTCPHCGTAHPLNRPCLQGMQLPVRAGSTLLPIRTIVNGRFRILGVEHRSGMSTVYRAADQRGGNAVVALKEFNADGLAEAERGEALVWLTREASLLSILEHPRLPRLLAAFSEGDRHYLAMPFLEGETLEEIVARSGPLAEVAVLRWAHDIALLLAYLHRQDPPVIHRDLKPANVLVRRDGSLTLLDLGVARPMDRRRIGTAIGTPGFAPPEQYQGLADERSDLFALGATMHRLLTGYDAERAAPFRHPQVRDLNPAISKRTAALVGDLLQLAPTRRPPSAQSVGAAIEWAADDLAAAAILPVHRMYGQMLAAVGGASAIGVLLYAATPAFDDTTSIALLLVTALVCALPLFGRHLLRAARAQQDFAQHRHRATGVLLRAFAFVLVFHTPFTAGLAAVLLAHWLFLRYRETTPALYTRSLTRLAP